MKKIINILIFNIILLSVFLFLLDLIIKNHDAKDINKINYNRSNIIISDINPDEIEYFPKNFNQIEWTEKKFMEYCGEERFDINVDYSGRPIVFLGCSYIYGHGIKFEESFPYRVSEISHKPVYSFATCGSDLVDTLIFLRDAHYEYFDRIKNAEYVIYLYMYDHINRYIDHSDRYYEYAFNPNKIEKFLIKISVFRSLLARLRLIKLNSEFPKTDFAISMLKNIFVNCIHEIREYMPDSKIIFIVYDEKVALYNVDYYFVRNNQIRFDKDIMHSNIWNELSQEEGITIVYTKDIIGKTLDKDYKLKEDFADWHPNTRIWKEFTPEFVNRYLK